MNKEEFKKMFKELCKSREIDFSVEWHNDRNQYLVIKVDNEMVFEECIEKD